MSTEEAVDVAGIAAAGAGRTTRASGRRLGLGVLSGSLAVPAVLVGMIALFSALRPDTFGTTANLQSLLTTQAVLVILALGVTVVCAVGEFDLSCAAVLGFTATIVASLTVESGVSTPIAMLVALAVSLLVGVLNALFVVGLGVNSFVTTLGMGTVVTGVAIGAIGPTTIGGLPQAATAFAQSSLWGVGLPFFFALALVGIGWFVLERTATGRHIFFVGEGRSAARLVGLRVDRIRAGGLVVGALAAGLAGLVLAGQTGAASPTYGGPFLLPAYAAAFLGATVHRGRFGAPGTFLAVYLLAVGTLGLQMVGAPEWVTQVFSGAVLILAVTLARLTSGRTTGG